MRRRKVNRPHQPGYLEKKACRILEHAKAYNAAYFPGWTWEVYERAFDILEAAHAQARQARKVALQLIRGY